MTEIRFFSGFSVEMFPLPSLVIAEIVETVEPGIMSGYRLAKAIGPMNGQRYCVCAVLRGRRCFTTEPSQREYYSDSNVYRYRQQTKSMDISFLLLFIHLPAFTLVVAKIIVDNSLRYANVLLRNLPTLNASYRLLRFRLRF